MAVGLSVDYKTYPMITHTSDPHQIPSQNKTKSKLQILKIAKNSKFGILHDTLNTTHLLKLLHKMYKYEMDPTRTVGATERTPAAGRTDGRTDGRTEWNRYTRQQLHCARDIIISTHFWKHMAFAMGEIFSFITTSSVDIFQNKVITTSYSYSDGVGQ